MNEITCGGDECNEYVDNHNITATSSVSKSSLIKSSKKYSIKISTQFALKLYSLILIDIFTVLKVCNYRQNLIYPARLVTLTNILQKSSRSEKDFYFFLHDLLNKKVN